MSASGHEHAWRLWAGGELVMAPDGCFSNGPSRLLCGTINSSMRFRKERMSEAGLQPRFPQMEQPVMKRITLSVAATVAGLVIGPSLASALTAMTTEPANLRAGPAFDFPVVDSIPDDATVTVHGCVRAYRWCDISWRDARGWVSGDELAYFYQQRYVPVVEYGPRIGLPIVVFSFDTYWDRYYRGRPFYGERTRWRTVWRDRDGDGRKNADRPRDRREGKADRQSDRRQGDGDRREGKAQSDRRQGEADRRQTDGRRDASRRQGDDSDRGMNRPANREDRSSGRADRGETRERSGGRALSPGADRGPDRDAGGRSEGRSERPSGGGSQGGRDGGGGGQGDRRSN